MPLSRYVIIGATGKVGSSLAQRLLEQGASVVAVGRSSEKLASLKALGATPLCFDLESPAPFPLTLTKGDCLINAAHARYTAPIFHKLGHGYGKFILIGSTRKYSKLSDPAADAVRAAEFLTRQASPAYVILHPTMIYGAAGENNVQRIAALAKKVRVVFLPAQLKARIQPIFAQDLVQCILSAAHNNALTHHIIDVGGPKPLSYPDFLQAIFAASTTWAQIVPVPSSLVKIAAYLTRFVPLLPQVSPQEIDRLHEDKAINIAPMLHHLNIRPRPFDEGLHKTFHP